MSISWYNFQGPGINNNINKYTCQARIQKIFPGGGGGPMHKNKKPQNKDSGDEAGAEDTPGGARAATEEQCTNMKNK